MPHSYSKQHCTEDDWNESEDSLDILYFLNRKGAPILALAKINAGGTILFPVGEGTASLWEVVFPCIVQDVEHGFDGIGELWFCH